MIQLTNIRKTYTMKEAGLSEIVNHVPDYLEEDDIERFDDDYGRK